MKINSLSIFTAITLFVLIFSCRQAGAQESSAPGKIKSVTEVAIEAKSGNDVEINKSFRAFDAQGNLIEEIDYDDAGKIQSHTISEFNQKNQKIKETMLLPDGKTESVSLYTYDEEGNRTSKTTLNKDGVVKSKKVYRYEYR